MSLLPFLYDMDPWGYRPRRFAFSNLEPYDMGITPEEIRALIEFPRLRFNPQSNRVAGGSGDSCPVSVGKDGFQACVDVKQFRPSEISVKTVGDTVVIEGKHEERQDDHGYISRHFVRKYTLPRGYDATKVVSTLSSDGVLTVSAPPPGGVLEGNERVVQVQQTGPAHLNVKENPKKDNPKEEKKK